MAERRGRSRHRRRGGAVRRRGVHLFGRAFQAVFFGLRERIRLPRYVFRRLLPIPRTGDILGVLVEVYRRQPLRLPCRETLQGTGGAYARQGLFRADHQRRPPLPGGGLPEREALLHTGRLRTLPMLPTLSQKDVRQRKCRARNGRKTAQYAHSVRADTALPRVRQTDVRESAQRLYVRRGRGLARRMRAV